MKKKKISKEDVERVNKAIVKIREEQKKREEMYRKKYNPKIEELKEKIKEGKRLRKESKSEYKKVIDRLDKEKKLTNLEYDIRKKFAKQKYEREKERIKKLPIDKYAKKEILRDKKSFLKEKLGRLKSREKFEGQLTSALKKQQKNLLPSTSLYGEQIAKKRLLKGALVLGSRIEAGINVALEGSLNKLKKIAKAPITSRKILKKSKMSYTMPKREVTNVFNDENRFFKGAINNGLI